MPTQTTGMPWLTFIDPHFSSVSTPFPITFRGSQAIDRVAECEWVLTRLWPEQFVWDLFFIGGG